MDFTVEASIRPVKHGIDARSADLNMCGHGEDEDSAIESLRRTVQAWVIGLRRGGVLEQTLAAKEIGYDLSSPDEVNVQINYSASGA